MVSIGLIAGALCIFIVAIVLFKKRDLPLEWKVHYMSGLFDKEETNELQLYVNDVEKSLLFYKKIIALKLSIQMDISSELRIKR